VTSIGTSRILEYARKSPLVSLLFVTLVSAGAATLVFPETAEITGTLAVILATAASGALFLVGVRKLEGRDKLVWSGVGFAMVLASAGVLVIAILSSTGADLPAFGPLDTFFIGSYILLFVSVVALPHTAGRWSVRALAMVDGLVGAIALATVAWVWILADYFLLLAEAPVGQRAIAMAYPILDVAILISVLLLSVRRSNYWLDRRLLLLSIGLVFQVLADLAYASTGVGAMFEEATPIYVLNIAAGIFLVAAASIVHIRPEPREFADRPTRWTTLIAPYGAALVLVSGLVWHTLEGGSHIPLLAVSTLAVVLLTFARQGISIREYRYRVDDDRQNLVSSISHELRTPLTSMYGMLELLRAGEVVLSAEEKKEFLETATDQARYMGRIVSDLIMLARGRDDILRVVPFSHDLKQLIREAVARVDGREIVDMQVPVLAIEVDRDRFCQAITGLVDNGVKYGASRVLVSVVKGEDLVIEVHDDGPGVPTKFELVIWNRFERGPRSLDSRVPGSGNGLALVAKVAHAHGGHAGYRRSEILGGACFFISIPLIERRPEIHRIDLDPVPHEIAV